MPGANGTTLPEQPQQPLLSARQPWYALQHMHNRRYYYYDHYHYYMHKQLLRAQSAQALYAGPCLVFVAEGPLIACYRIHHQLDDCKGWVQASCCASTTCHGGAPHCEYCIWVVCTQSCVFTGSKTLLKQTHRRILGHTLASLSTNAHGQSIKSQMGCSTFQGCCRGVQQQSALH